MVKYHKSIVGKKAMLGSSPLGNIMGILFALFFMGILVFAFALAGSNMISSTTDATAKSVINTTVQGVTSYANFSSTLWTMAGVAALIVILLVGIGAYIYGRQ